MLAADAAFDELKRDVGESEYMEMTHRQVEDFVNVHGREVRADLRPLGYSTRMIGRPSEPALLVGPVIAANATAFAVAGVEAGTALISTVRPVARWSELTVAERIDVLALVDALGVAGGSVRFDLEAPGEVPWHLCVRPAPAGFSGLPAFVGGQEQRLLPALQAALALADEADLLSAFIQVSGVALLRDDLEHALRRGAAVRILTGDYLGITHPEALRELADLASAFTALKVRVYRCEGSTSFHAKAYIFVTGAAAVAYVGSSNLSRAALTSAVEWNLRAVQPGHAPELAAIRARFERLWGAPETVALSHPWIDAYAARLPAPAQWDPPAQPPTPHEIQRQALDALARARLAGATRGLVVLATGLGKTLLAAFDAQQMGARRVLFVAHREEIIVQAREAFARVFPGRSAGLFKGSQRERGAELVFASVQTLARPEHLASWARDHFDLIVIDEFHHAAALGYRRVLGHFTPRFMLGITATPERGDGAELLALCEDRLIFRADLARGIESGRLVPFIYHGLKDAVDYLPIPWRSSRFDPVALGAALATVAHAERALEGYKMHAPPAPRRGLWFCASIAHAEFMASFLSERGVAAVAVHSEKGGAPRGPSLHALMAGELEAITTVDVFNEGIDVPDINVVVLLRPTESSVVFLQQLGRGLRLPERSSKPHLVILDFIGNHHSFLSRPRALFALLGVALAGEAAARRLRERDLQLPPGCSVHIETEVIDLLTRMAGERGGDQALAVFRRLRDDLGRRPSLRELAATGLQVGVVARTFGSWWDLLLRQDALHPDEQRMLAIWRDDLMALERARERSPAAWSALGAWLELGGVTRAVEVAAPSDDAALAALWPAAVVRRGDAVGLRRPVDDIDAPVLEAMIDEIAEARLADGRRARTEVPTGIPLQVKRGERQAKPGEKPVKSRPILRFRRTAETPASKEYAEVWVDGQAYSFYFVDIAVNVARRRPGGDNVLGSLLTDLFGPDAGKNGTDDRAVLRKQDDRWTLFPSLPDPSEAAPTLPYYRDLAVACGLGDTQHAGADATTPIRIRGEHVVDARRHFVVRARGDSMHGGDRPIRDGDLVLCARADGPAPDFVEGKPCLLVAQAGPDASEAMIKVPTRTGDGGWVLRSWSRDQVDIPVARWEQLTVVARVLGVVEADHEDTRRR